MGRQRPTELGRSDAFFQIDHKFNQNHDRLGRFTFSEGGESGGGSAGVSSNGQQSRHYKTQTSHLVIPPKLHDRIDAIGSDFQKSTGKTMVVSSGTRSAERQADAMYWKFKAGASGSDYVNQKALLEIRNTYDDLKNRKSRSEVIAAMTRVIQRQKDNNTYISKHIIDGAFDISPIYINHQDMEKLILIARRHGAKATYEPKPAHVHIQF